jgi:pimeloyl-ACP methyl ester carboxylesterase
VHPLRFTTQSSSNGMLERNFTVGDIPGVLWSPAPGTDRAPLVLMGHGGGAHKTHPAMAGRAHLLVTGCGFHVAVIDAPGHGDRPRTAQDEQEIAELRKAQEAGEPEGPIVVRYNARLAELAVPEWQATLDALQQLPEIGAEEPIGYVGIGLGTAVGVPLVAIEPRITAAVFVSTWPDVLLENAQQITVPVESPCSGTTSASRARPAWRCSTPSPPRRRRCTPTRARTWNCPGSRPTARSGSSPGISAGR